MKWLTDIGDYNIVVKRGKMNEKITRQMLSDTVTDANEVVIFHEEIIL